MRTRRVASALAGRREGFTLLEAVVALAIVGTIAIAVLGSFGTELRTASRVRSALPAVPLAEEQLARLSSMDAQTLAMLPDSVARGNFAAPFGEYAWSAKADEITDVPGLIDLVVVVTWPDGRYELRTRVYRPVRTQGDVS